MKRPRSASSWRDPGEARVVVRVAQPERERPNDKASSNCDLSGPHWRNVQPWRVRNGILQASWCIADHGALQQRMSENQYATSASSSWTRLLQII
jgi:hypothetical protein